MFKLSDSTQQQFVDDKTPAFFKDIETNLLVINGKACIKPNHRDVLAAWLIKNPL